MKGGWPFPAGGVSLVGAGPGDADLLTLRAARRLREAEVLVYDNLVHPDVLALVANGAERCFVGKSSGHHTLPQADINALLLAKARAGQRVVRLKGGDPGVFGRGGEEMEALLSEGVAVEIVPGITAALGAAASFGFPLTHRDHAHSCVFVTGHRQHDQLDLNWQALAQPNQTVVIYMGVAGLEEISTQLQAAGLPADTPAALIYRATWPEQRLYRAALATLPQVARLHHVEPPTLLVIGGVVGQCRSAEAD